MDGDVEDDAASCARLFNAPALEVRRQINGVENAGEKRLADTSCLNGFPHRSMRRSVSEMMVGSHHDAALSAFSGHCTRIVEGKRKRLLAEHMFAGGRGRKDLVAMELVGRRNIDCVDRLVFDERSKVRRCLRDFVLRGIPGCPVGVRAHDGDNVSAVGAKGVDHMLGRNRARADDPPAKSGHYRLSS